MSADPFIQAPTNSQSLNRYTYVINNPLSLTDPSGFFFKGLFKIVVTAVVAYFTYGAGTGLLGLSEYAATALAGFAGGLAGSGGNLKMGIIGAVTASAFYGIGTHFSGVAQEATMAYGPGIGMSNGMVAAKVIAHGVVGGISSLASGGEFLTGFLSAGFTQATSNINNLYTQGKGINLGNAAKAAVVGGTASVLGGGKFANGAITGAFSRMFNDDLEHGAQEGGLYGDGAGQTAHEIAELLWPGYDFGTCISQGCGGGTWAIATVGLIPGGKGVAVGLKYTAKQLQNIKRFRKSVPSNAKNSLSTAELPNGGVAVQATSPGKVPGSKAVYEKQIDSSGNTIQMTKTTYAPDGSIVHVKDKLNGGVYP